MWVEAVSGKKAFFFPDTASTHTHPVNSTANTDVFKSVFQSGKEKSAANPITCGRVNPDIFESNDVANRFQSITVHKPIWRHSVQICRHYRTLAMAHTLGSRVNPDTIRCMWTGKFNLNTLRMDGEIVESGKKKLRIQKYPDTRGQGLSFTVKPTVHTNPSPITELFENAFRTDGI